MQPHRGVAEQDREAEQESHHRVGPILEECGMLRYNVICMECYLVRQGIVIWYDNYFYLVQFEKKVIYN